MITLAAIVILVGVTIQASAFSLGQLISARVITGMCIEFDSIYGLVLTSY